MTTPGFALLALLGLTLATSQSLSKGGRHAGSPFRSEQKNGEGRTTRGEYGFRSPDGCLHVISYETDMRAGYRVLGSSKKDCHLEATTRKTFTTTTTTTTTTPRTTTTRPRPRDPLSAPPVSPVVDNTLTDSQGRQLQRPDLSSISSSEGEPKPLYSFGFTTSTHGHSETGLPDGSKQGEYYWDGPDGYRRIVTYVANENGFYPRMRQVRISTTTPRSTSGNNPDNNVGKELGPNEEEQIAIPVGGCPYYFYYNTRINYHWEHCYENNTKVGEYGSLGSDGYARKNAYVADATGFHPTLSKTPLTARQQEVMAEYTKGAFIIPKPDEERRETEKRILVWLSENKDRVEQPLR